MAAGSTIGDRQLLDFDFATEAVADAKFGVGSALNFDTTLEAATNAELGDRATSDLGLSSCPIV